MNRRLTLLSAFSFIASVWIYSQGVNNIIVHTNKIGTEIQPTMYGHFFEDINYGADGGLYAELVKNRSFEFPQNFMGWSIFGNVKLLNDGPFEKNPHYVRLSYSGHPAKSTGIENEGFFGIGVKAEQNYRFSVWARGEKQKIRVELIDNDSMGETQVLIAQELGINSKEWKKYELILTPKQTLPGNVLQGLPFPVLFQPASLLEMPVIAVPLFIPSLLTAVLLGRADVKESGATPAK